MNKGRINRLIAENVLISSEWTKIIPQKPIEIKKFLQAVLLQINGCWLDENDKNFKLPDGTNIKPEVIIFDEFSNEYPLKSGLSFGRPDTDSKKWVISEIGFNSKLPKDRVYTEIRIRNEKPFQCAKISWYDYNLK